VGDTPTKRGRRGQSRGRSKCARVGCPRTAAAGREYCSSVCHFVVNLYPAVENVCRATGSDPVAVEAWASLVTLNDALTDFLKADNRVYRAALDRWGMTPDQLAELRRA